MDPTHLFSLEEKMVIFPRKVACHGLLFEFGEEFSFLTVYIYIYICFSEKKASAFFTTDLRGSLQVGRSGDVSKIMWKNPTSITNLRQSIKSTARWCYQACLFTKKILEGEDVPCWRTCVLSFDSLDGQQTHEILSCTYTGLLGYNPSYGNCLGNPVTLPM